MTPQVIARPVVFYPGSARPEERYRDGFGTTCVGPPSVTSSKRSSVDLNVRELMKFRREQLGLTTVEPPEKKGHDTMVRMQPSGTRPVEENSSHSHPVTRLSCLYRCLRWPCPEKPKVIPQANLS